MFFDICRILEEKKPYAFMLENVFNLVTHDGGNTFKVMQDSLKNLGYTINYKVLNARNFGVPQNRDRIIIVGCRDNKKFDFDKLETNTIDCMYPFLDKEGDFEILGPKDYTILEEQYVHRQPKSGLIFIGHRNKKIRVAGVRPGTEHLSRVHKMPNRIYSAEGTHPTIASQELSGRYWIYVDGIVRKLTINECFRFFGFPEDFKKCGILSKQYERIGNSVCVNMISADEYCSWHTTGRFQNYVFEVPDRNANFYAYDFEEPRKLTKPIKVNVEKHTWVEIPKDIEVE